jgi:hypothetical protein
MRVQQYHSPYQFLIGYRNEVVRSLVTLFLILQVRILLGKSVNPNDILRLVPHSLQTHVGIVPYNKPRPLFFIFLCFTIHRTYMGME